LSQPGSLARGAAVITVATAISRITGFARVVAVAAAMGTTFLANTYQTANTAPNVVFELVAAGVLTSIFVPTFVDYLVRRREEEGWEAANALTTVALMGLIVLSLVVALAAPLIMRALTVGVADQSVREEEVRLGSTFLRLFAPQIVFYGLGMIMTGALHAHRRFALPAIAPIFNNVVVIGVYVAFAFMRGSGEPTLDDVTDGEVLLLGAGTTAGVIAMTICLIPQVRRLGWRFRVRPQLSHPAVKRGARLGVWALGYAGGYQAGLIVVLLLANRVEGGVAAYQWAYTFFYLPHALFGIPIFHVLFTAMSEHVAREERAEMGARLGEGLAMLVFLLAPLAATLVVLAPVITRLTLQYGVMTQAGADQVARVLIAFATGLPAYSAFLVFTRAFYAVGEVRTPALVNALAVGVASAAGALFFFSLPDEWSVAGLALGHSVGFTLGLGILAGAFARKGVRFGDPALTRSLLRSLGTSLLVLIAMAITTSLLPEGERVELLLNAIGTVAVGGALYLVAMKTLGASELDRLRSLLPGVSR
jgi:putative peptidoglycan lipid II flippase